MSVVDASDRPNPTLAVGEEVYLEADWTTSGLGPTDSYVVGFTVDGVTIDSSTISGASGSNLGYYWYLGGWFASPGSHAVSVTVDPSRQVSGADESLATKTTSFTPQAPSTLPARFINPMGTVNGAWTIVNYVDTNPASPAISDYQGGDFTYDGHTGMDLTLANFPMMDAGYPVYAAASGTVSEVVDGNFDRDTGSSSVPANDVVVDLGNGWQTIYYHFMSGSIALKVGDAVAAGQMIGLVGSSGNSTDPHLHFEVHHDGDVVETNFAPSSYWVAPYSYAGTTPAYAMDSGITDSSPFGDAKERPVDMSVFPVSSTSTGVWYWCRASYLKPTDSVLVNWYKPNGTLSTTYTESPPVDDVYDLQGWVLPSSTWGAATGTWHVGVSVNGVEMSRQAFTVTAGTGVPALRLTQGATGGTEVVNNRTTPIDFGSSAQGAVPTVLSFSVQNVGLAPLVLSNRSLPAGFSPVGAFPSTIAAGSAATFTVQMNTASVGTQFGQMTFSTNVPGTPTYGFNLTGIVTGAANPSAPTITFGRPAVVFDPRVGPVAIDPAIAIADGSAGGVAGGALSVQFASAGTASDHLAIANQGTGAGKVGLVGNVVTFGGAAVGTVAGGDNLAPLVVTFNASSSVAAAQAIARDVVFRSDLPANKAPRFVRVSLTDSAGLASNQPVKKVETDPGVPGMVPSIPGSVYLDLNDDGVREAGEPGVAGRVVYLDTNGNGAFDPFEPSAMTDSNGNYALANTPVGQYSLRVRTYPFDVATGPSGSGIGLSLVAAQPSSARSFGLRLPSTVSPIPVIAAPFGPGVNPDTQTAIVKGLYNLILNRPADPGGLAGWVGALKGGATASQVATAFYRSAEYAGRVVANDYRTFLGRAAAPSEVNAWVSALQAGASETQVAGAILGSSEFSAAHASGDAFVQALYQDVLGRTASAGEVAAWAPAVTTPAGRASVAAGFVTSAESESRSIADDYAAILGRAGTLGEVNSWLPLLQGGLSLDAIAIAFFGSAEFSSRASRGQ